MKLYTIFDMDAEKCGPIFTAENDAVCMRMVFSEYKNMAVHVSSRMQLLHVADMDMNTGILSGHVVDYDDVVKAVHYDGVVGFAPRALMTIKEIVDSFLSSLEVKDVKSNDS